jgi:hypothetical protein
MVRAIALVAAFALCAAFSQAEDSAIEAELPQGMCMVLSPDVPGFSPDDCAGDHDNTYAHARIGVRPDGAGFHVFAGGPDYYPCTTPDRPDHPRHGRMRRAANVADVRPQAEALINEVASGTPVPHRCVVVRFDQSMRTGDVVEIFHDLQRIRMRRVQLWAIDAVDDE